MTPQDNAESSSWSSLRQRAEGRLKIGHEDVAAMSPEQVQRLVYELQVHQMELQLQNEELLVTQAELTEVSDRYFELFELAPVGYVTSGPDYRIDHCNLTAAELLGTERTKMKGAELRRLVSQKDRDSCFVAMREAMESGTQQTCECTIALSAGKTRHLHLTIAPRNERRTADGCRVTLTDITLQKNYESALRASEARFRTYIDQAPDAILVHDLHFRLCDANPRAWTSLGYTRDEFFRLSPKDIDSNFDPVAARAIYGQLTPGDSVTVSARHRRKDGSTFPVEVRITCFNLEGEPYYLALSRDVTEREQREADLDRTRNQLAEAQQIAHLGSWEYTSATQETVSSDEQKRIFGLAPNRPSPSYEEILYQYIHPEDAAVLDQCFRDALRNGETFEAENRIVRPDGCVRFIYNKAQPHFDAMGKVERYVGVTLDVTERRAMQEKIQQWNAELERTVAVRTAELTTEQARATRALERVAASESRFRTMFEQAPLGVALIESLNGRICEVNSRFAEIVGRTREELVTSFWMSQLHPDDAQADLDNVAKLNSGGIPCVRFDNRCIRPDGSLVWVRMTHAPLKLDAGEMPRHLCMIEDVTERRAADEALRASEEKFRSLVENISECIWELDAQGRFTYISPTFRELTGYSPDEYLGKTPASLISADGDRIFRELAQAAKEDQHRIPPVEFRGRRKDGQCYDVEVKGMIRCSNAGQFLGMRGIVRDITDRKRAEESLKRFNEDLERQVQQRTAAIHMLRDVAVMANETHDPLLAAEYCLKQIATQHGWLCGHVWWMDGEDEKFLLPRCVWYPADTCRWDEFRTVTLQTRLRRNTELPGRAIAGGRPHWTTQLQRALIAPRAAVARKLGLATAVAAPVFARGRPVAVLEFFSECQLPRDPGIVDVLTGVTLQLGRVFERREFEEHLLASTEDVRRGIAQDLHDDVGQELTGVSLLAAALAKSNPPATPSAEKISSEISSSLSRTHEKLRSLCHSAMPRELQEGNLVIAIKQLAVFTRDNSRIECDFAYELPEEAFDSRSSTQLYRIVQEAISNAIRHARARSIRIAMRQERGDLLLTIEDDGKGLPDGLPMSHGMGLQTMRYRAGMLGGTLEVGPAQGRGMRVVCRVPAAIQSSPTPTAAKRDSRCRRKS